MRHNRYVPVSSFHPQASPSIPMALSFLMEPLLMISFLQQVMYVFPDYLYGGRINIDSEYYHFYY